LAAQGPGEVIGKSCIFLSDTLPRHTVSGPDLSGLLERLAAGGSTNPVTTLGPECGSLAANYDHKKAGNNYAHKKGRHN
jgi:hypothetical protein